MKWIKAGDLQDWSNKDQIDCIKTIPELLRRLIRFSVDSIKEIRFPSGDNVLRSGFDGILDVEKGTEYIPKGKSLWEIGTTKKIKLKADQEFTKRSRNSLGLPKSKTTFVFVTPRIWSESDQWARTKRGKKSWKSVKVISALELEEWLEQAPPVAAWLAEHLKISHEGVLPAELFHERWFAGVKIKLDSQIVLAGRDTAKNDLLISSISPSLISVQGSSTNESLAFITSAFINDPIRKDNFNSRAVIVDNPAAFEKLVAFKSPLVIIPKFENLDLVHFAISKGHTVIVPSTPESSLDLGKRIILPRLQREGFIKALLESGIGKEKAESYSKESARNINILRRLLKIGGEVPEWARKENVRDIIPALLISQWNEPSIDNNRHPQIEVNDKEIISRLAGIPYEKYVHKITKWLNASDSPFIKVGTSWKVASSLDVWSYAAKHITNNDLSILRESFLQVLGETHPMFELEPDKRIMASWYGKSRKYSESIREGLIQTVTIISVYGKEFKLDLPPSCEIWVDGLIRELLNTSSLNFWKSIDRYLPQIAEASPNSFLSALERQVYSENSSIPELFIEEKGLIYSSSYITGLLWGLENIAWLPEYLSRTTLVLGRLVQFDRPRAISNSPINSLTEIYKPWHYQTHASFKERMDVLTLLSQQQRQTAWTLLIKLLPDHFMIGHGTHKMRLRWRISEGHDKKYTYEELWKTWTEVIDLLLSITTFSESEVSDLIDASTKLPAKNRNRILTHIEKNHKEIKQVGYVAWHGLRKILSFNRSHKGKDSILSESELKGYQELYFLLQPDDDVKKIIWMFSDQWPEFPEGYSKENDTRDGRSSFILKKRLEALDWLYNEVEIEETKRIASQIENSYTFGDTLAYLVKNEKEIISVCEYLTEDDLTKLQFAKAFLFRKFELLKNPDWIFDMYGELKSKNFTSNSLGLLLGSFTPSRRIWEFLQKEDEVVRKTYWANVFVNFYNLSSEDKILGLKYLVEYDRPFSAIRLCTFYKEQIDSDTILAVLEKAIVTNNDDSKNADLYTIENIFDILYERTDVEKNKLAVLEWRCLPLLTSVRSKRAAKLLHSELAVRPEFFIEMLKFAYKPENNNERLQSEHKDLTEEQIKARAMRAMDLLHTWKTIPSVDENGNIDKDVLWNWINKVTELAKDCDRLNMANMYIGEIIAQYPEGSEQWPPDEICQVIETIQSKELNDGFRVAVSNNRGVSSRAPFDGGSVERARHDYFHSLADKKKNKFPTTSEILNQLAARYKVEAGVEDLRAEWDELEY